MEHRGPTKVIQVNEVSYNTLVVDTYYNNSLVAPLVLTATDLSSYPITKASAKRHEDKDLLGKLVIVEKYKKGKWTLKEIL